MASKLLEETCSTRTGSRIRRKMKPSKDHEGLLILLKCGKGARMGRVDDRYSSARGHPLGGAVPVHMGLRVQECSCAFKAGGAFGWPPWPLAAVSFFPQRGPYSHDNPVEGSPAPDRVHRLFRY
ncbi:hypothetical protein AAG570_006592 [Ranatra chinensis]|uniref:Uncharacterized protein n=1 Tax=Ranatra chinensis TaxID=642074 RepID=A0ABD0YUF8_9HEMI